MRAGALVSVRNLVVRYGATTALGGIDLDVDAGEVHAVVGENGAGKSTLLRAIAGVVRHISGHLARDAGVRLAWVPQETVLPPDLTDAIDRAVDAGIPVVTWDSDAPKSKRQPFTVSTTSKPDGHSATVWQSC